MKAAVKRPSRLPLIGLAAALLALVGCASSPQLGATYVDPQLAKGGLRGASVLVVCDAPEPAQRLLCESQVSSQLLQLGARPVTDAALASPSPGREVPASTYVDAARAAGATAILSATLTPDYSLASQTPTFSIGIGGFGASGGYRGGSGIGGGVGVNVPVGAPPGQAGVAALASLVDAGSARVLWSAKATTAPGGDATALVTEAIATLAASLRQAGIF